MHKRFEGRVAIVTGSSRGIGRAIALPLAAEGAAVILNGRQAEPLVALIAEITDAGGKAAVVVGSVSEPAIPAELVRAARENFSRIDIVVNKVGVSPYYGPLMASIGKDSARHPSPTPGLQSHWEPKSCLSSVWESPRTSPAPLHSCFPVMHHGSPVRRRSSTMAGSLSGTNPTIGSGRLIDHRSGFLKNRDQQSA